MERSFCFILSLLKVDGELPIELIPGHWFQKADTEQCDRIKEVLDFFKFLPFPLTFFYETEVIEEPQDDSSSKHFKHDMLTPEDWRYWVISFEGWNTELRDLQNAANLLKNDLDFGFQVLGSGIANRIGGASDAFSFSTVDMSNFYSNLGFAEKPITISSQEIGEITTNYNLIKQLDGTYSHIIKAIQSFSDLKKLSGNSELTVTGYFAVIESLITHTPKLTESADSISHQLKTKIPLLSKSFQRQLDYFEYFGNANEEKIWTKLYEYRSRIVHGEKVDFGSSLRILKNIRNVWKFLKEATKLLLLHAIKEPSFVTDLKKC